MKIKNLFIASLTTMIIALVCMGLNWFVLPLPDIAVRVIGVTVLIDLFVLIYSRVKLKNNKAS